MSTLDSLKRTAQMRPLVVVIWVALALVGLNELLPWGGLILVAFVVAGRMLWSSMETEGIPFCEIALFVNVIQLLLAPWVSYGLGTTSSRYEMAVSPDPYFSYVYPAVCLFGAGLSAISAKIITKKKNWETPYWAKSLAWSMLILGFIADWVGQTFGILSFFFYLLSQTRYIAVMLALRYHLKRRWLIVALGLYPLIVSSGKYAMFHDLLIWSAFLTIFYYSSKPRLLGTKVALLTTGILLVIFIQFSKNEYREAIRLNPDSSKLKLFVESASAISINDLDSWRQLNTRLNQGWITANVLSYVPKSRDFVDGRTFKEAVMEALLIRGVSSKNTEAGGREKFREFTGLSGTDLTSMGIGIIAEAYVNFGPSGSLLFLGLLGLCFASLVSTLHWASSINPLWMYLSPLIIYQAVKAETDMAVVFNQISKGLIVALFLYLIFYKMTKRSTIVRSRLYPRLSRRKEFTPPEP